MKRIVFTGGGTAGHIVPNLSLATILHQKGYDIHYIGSENGMEKNMVALYPYITYHSIPCVKLIRSLTWENLKIPFVLCKSIKQAKKVLQNIQPDVIFSKGGYVSLPTVLAAKDIPIIAHESDMSLGLANKIIYQNAKKMCFTFPNIPKKYIKKGVFTGPIIHPKFYKTNASIIKKQYQFSSSKPNLLVVGGSLGAQSINQMIQDHLSLLTSRYNIIHIVGKGKQNKKIHQKYYVQVEFVQDIENYYAWADLIITRGGSNAIHEILFMQKPMLIIPLSKKSSRGDQIDNALSFSKRGIAHVLLEENMTIFTLLESLKEMYKYTNIIQDNMKQEKNINGTQKIISLIEDYACSKNKK